MSKFGGTTRKAQTEARRWVYGVLATLLDNEQERSEEGWFALGQEGDEFDRRRLHKALDEVRKEMFRKSNRTP